MPSSVKPVLDVRTEVTIHQRHLALVFEVGDAAQPAHDRRRAPVPGIVDEQALERLDLDARLAAAHLADHRHAFGDREVRAFLRVEQDRDDDSIEQIGRAHV